MPHSDLKRKLFLGAAIGTAGYWLAKSALWYHRKIHLANKTVLITGGSRGLGLALAQEFARHGAKIAICARDESELQQGAQDIRAIDADVHTFPCDLRDSAQAQNLIHQVESTCGPIDVLVNNAGTIVVGPAAAMSLEDFRDVMAINFWGAVHTTLAAIPGMRARGFGRIVNIASLGAKMPVPHLAPYCASKFALEGFSTSMRAEFAKDGILITTVNPGLMNTGSPRNALFKGNHKAEYAWFSISDALPGIAMSAPSAARRIVRAAIHGDPEVTLGLPAKLGAKMYGLFPSLHTELAALTNRALPADENPQIKPGRESESPLTQSFLRHAGHRAEQNLNQLQT